MINAQFLRQPQLDVQLTVSVEANLREQVKHSSRSQNCRISKELPA
jgi:hypothetical protein